MMLNETTRHGCLRIVLPMRIVKHFVPHLKEGLKRMAKRTTTRKANKWTYANAQMMTKTWPIRGRLLMPFRFVLMSSLPRKLAKDRSCAVWYTLEVTSCHHCHGICHQSLWDDWCIRQRTPPRGVVEEWDHPVGYCVWDYKCRRSGENLERKRARLALASTYLSSDWRGSIVLVLSSVLYSIIVAIVIRFVFPP